MIRFRTAVVADIDGIMEMEYDSFHEEVREKRELFLERIQVFPEGFIIMEIEEKYAGYITSELWNFKEYRERRNFMINHSIKKCHDYNGKELYITSFAVKSEYRGKNYGKLMFEYFMDKMKEKYSPNCISLIVAERWEKAVDIYIKNGFKIVELFENFLEDVELHKNFIFMRKTELE